MEINYEEEVEVECPFCKMKAKHVITGIAEFEPYDVMEDFD